MYKKRILYSVLILLTVFWSGCSYELSDENVLNLEKPASSHPIDLSIVPVGDTIHITEKQLIDYTINTYGLILKKVEFKIGPYLLWDMTSTSGSFTIDPSNLSNGFYELSMNVYTNSGSGSLADKLNGEGYLAQRNWMVKISGQTTTSPDSTIDNTPTVPVKVKSMITPDGYLKFIWNKVKRKDFYMYQIHCSAGSSPVDIQRTNANDTTYKDSTYVGGTLYFRVDYSRLHDNSAVYGVDITLNETYPTISITGKGLDSIIVHWAKSKYRARYEVHDDATAVIFKSDADTSVTISAPAFGSSVKYTLYVFPRNIKTPDFFNSETSGANYILGTSILSNWPVFACNQTEKKVYAVNYDAINCYSLPDMTLYKTLSVKNMMNQGMFACPTNSSKVAALSSDNIYVFNDKSLTNPVTIPFPCYAKTVNYLCLTDNDLVGVATSAEYNLYRVSDQTLLSTIPIADSPVYSSWCCNAASSDGKYFVVVTMNGLHLYKIENTLVTEVYSDKRAYNSVLFDPEHPERFYVTLSKSNEIEMRSSADFSLIKSYGLPGNLNMLQNIDPETGYLLLTNYDSNYLYDLQNEKIVFKMANSRSSNFNPRFYFGNIFTSNGRYLNISNYIKP